MVPMAEVGAVFVGGVAAAVAVWGVVSQRIIHRRRTTLEFLTKAEADADILKARKKFIELAKQGGLAAFAAADKEDSDETQAIRLVLNEFELISIGIQRGIIDFKIYRLWNTAGTIKFWSHAAPFVLELRNRLNNQNIYREFETLVGWLNAKHTPRRGYFWGQWF